MLPPSFKVSASDWFPFDWFTSGAGNSKWLIMFDHFVIWHQDNSRHPLLVLFACSTLCFTTFETSIFLIWMHLIVLLAMIGKIPAEWFGSGPRWHSLIDTVQSEQAADVIGARVYRMSHGPSLTTHCGLTGQTAQFQRKKSKKATEGEQQQCTP